MENRISISTPTGRAALCAFCSIWAGVASAAGSITITDGATATPVDVESGVLEVRFEGRIAPHENTSIPLLTSEGKPWTGALKGLDLPEGWLCDIAVNEESNLISLANFRPDRAPAFPT